MHVARCCCWALLTPLLGSLNAQTPFLTLSQAQTARQCETSEVQEGQKHAPMVMCLLDNRGVGQSSSPRNTRDYNTAVMAADVYAVMV
jgi:hypothetical protein